MNNLCIAYTMGLRYTMTVNKKRAQNERNPIKEDFVMNRKVWNEIGSLCMCHTMLATGMRKNNKATDSIRHLNGE